MARFTKQGLILSILIMGLGVAFGDSGENLCQTPQSLPPDVDDLRMVEGDFTVERCTAALEYLRKEIPRRLIDAPDRVKALDSSEFWISYGNSLKVIEGFMLRQDALHAIELNKKSPRSSLPAVARFCEFLAQATYED